MRDDLIEALGAISDGMRDAGEHEDAAILDRAAAALEAAREDAERYRWLRSRVDWKRPGDESPWTTPSGVYLVATMVSAVYGNCDEQTDAAIDQARGKGVAG